MEAQGGSKSRLQVAGVFVIAATLGIAIRSVTSSAPSDLQDTASLESSTSSNASGYSADSRARPRVDDVLAAQGIERIALLHRFLPKADLSELELLGRALPRSNPDDYLTEVEIVAWRLVLMRWVALDPEAALAMEKETDVYQLVGYCYRVWAELDGHAAILHADDQDEPERVNAITHVFAAALQHDLETALRWCEEVPGQMKWVQAIAKTLANQNPKEAITWATELPTSTRTLAIEEIFAILASNDGSEVAFEHMEMIGSEALRNRAYESVTRSMIATDTTKVREQLESQPQSRARLFLSRELAQHYAKTDPSGGFEWAKSLPRGIERQQALAITAMALSKGKPEKLFAILDEIGWENTAFNPADTDGINGSSQHNSTLRIATLRAIKEVAQSDPLRAVQLLGNLVPGRSRYAEREFANAVALPWFRRDRPGFLAAFNRIPSENLQHAMMEEVVRSVDGEGFNALAQAAQSSESSGTREVLGKEISLRMLADRGAEETLGWLRTLGGKAGSVGSEKVLQSMAAEDPLLAARNLDLMESPDQWTLETVSNAIVNRIDPRHFPEVLPLLPESAFTGDIYRITTKRWFEVDSLATSKWVSGLDPGTGKDSATRSMVSELVNNEEPDFESAFAWAKSTNSVGSRQSALRQVYRKWVLEDASIADAALKKLNLPKEMEIHVRAPSLRIGGHSIGFESLKFNFNIGYEF